MLNFVFKAWVKYVNNWRIQTSINQVNPSTHQPTTLPKTIINCSQTNFSNNLTNHLSSTLSTSKKPKSHLLNKSFTHYPHHLLLRPLNEN